MKVISVLNIRNNYSFRKNT